MTREADGTAPRVDASQVDRWLRAAEEFALLDVREAGQFGESHPFFAVPLPYSRLEIEVGRLVPRLDTRVVLCDEGGEVASRAARRLQALGYASVSVLEGGNDAWRAAGFASFAGVNVPSKAFGELAEHHYRTPSVTAHALNAMLARGDDVVVVDGRPFAEYRKMNIPGSVCCPNGELVLRIAELAPDPRTMVVVNCAGRTRSIVGAQTLIDFGIANPVFALENGTQGWFLAGFALEHGASRKYPAAPRDAKLASLGSRARELASRRGIPMVSPATLDTWRTDASRTTYVFDVRTEEEYAQGTLAGAVHAPGGQLVQALDQWVGVRGARIVLVDTEGVRAVPVAGWLRGMGHDAWVLEHGVAEALAPVATAPSPRLPGLDTLDYSAAGNLQLIDLRSSADYRSGHAPAAAWSIRPRVVAAARNAKHVGLIADDPLVARAAAIDLREAGVIDVHLVKNAPVSQTSLAVPTDADRIDFLFFTSGRHDYNREAAIRYLAWETRLVEQLGATERAAYRLVAS